MTPGRVLVLAVALLAMFQAAAGGQTYRGLSDSRELVARTQRNLQRAAGFTTPKKDEKKRFDHALRSLSALDRRLSKNRFDKGKLNKAVGDVQSVVDHNPISAEDRDALAVDLESLRDMRSRDGRR